MKNSALINAIADYAQLDSDQALVFDLNLSTLMAYRERPELQALYSRALLDRMQNSQDLEIMWSCSTYQKETPHFESSLLLQELYARGLVLIAQKDSTTEVHQDSINELFGQTRYRESVEIQRSIAALLLESLANCNSPIQAHHLETQFLRLPDLSADEDLGRFFRLAKELTTSTERQPVAKVDLREKTPSMLRALGKFVGLGDYRMRVWLGGSPNYKHLVVKVAARDEKSARAAVEDFVSDFWASDKAASQEILDVFPPGSPWESGRYPVLKV